MSQTFTVEYKLPGMNEYTNANRSGPQVGASMKKYAEEVIFYAIRQAKIQPVSRPVILSYIWTEPGAKRDADNIAVAQKFVQDALVNAGVLPGDSMKHVKGFNHVFRDGKKHGVQVTIVEIEEA
jgi:Holliday junction resolvase RusA-like endonuclease